MSFRRWLCDIIGCHYGEKDVAQMPTPLPPELEQKDRAYREASHEMRNAVVDLQGAAKRYMTAFDILADRWDH